MFQYENISKDTEILSSSSSQIRRLAGGSIDYAHYEALARSLRGEAFRNSPRQSRGTIKRILTKTRDLFTSVRGNPSTPPLHA